MRSTQLITSALAVAATSALVGLGTAPGNAQIPDSMQPGTARERGALIECTGRAGKTPVLVNIYQNRTYGNYLEMTVDDGTPAEVSRVVESRTKFITGPKVRAASKIGGRKILIAGTAKQTGKTRKVNEVVEDAGYRIVSKGTHKLLKPVLTVTYGGRTGRLTCDNAFLFDLKVTKTPMVD